MQLTGKAVVITGAGRGIGRAIATHFAKKGARLALLDVSTADTQAVELHCKSLGAEAVSYSCDVTREDQVNEVFGRIARDFDQLDIQVNNAGITRDCLLVKVEHGMIVRKMSLDQWRAVIDVNLTGVFLCGREAASHMIRFAQGGVIINISSISRSGNTGQSNYSAAKAGVSALTVVWAKELARYGIRAGSIAPGMTRTEMMEKMKPEALEMLLRAVPSKRPAEVDEIALAAAFIAENDYFSGRCIAVDGGMRL
jgi:3-oxoacyl-[acyl-carrier protein] reductase